MQDNVSPQLHAIVDYWERRTALEKQIDETAMAYANTRGTASAARRLLLRRLRELNAQLHDLALEQVVKEGGTNAQT